MSQETNKSQVAVIVALISTLGVICAAIIGLGLPIVQKLADSYLSTSTPYVMIVTPTNLPDNSSPNLVIATETPVQPIVSANEQMPIPTQEILPSPIPLPTSTLAPLLGAIPFELPEGSGNLNPSFGWQTGASSANMYDLTDVTQP